MLAAIIGLLQLETVIFMEHDGLWRTKFTEYRYENVQALHSWSRNHLTVQMILYDLSRHLEHHYRADKPFQELDHLDGSPQMPTGNPGMNLGTLLPPLWIFTMDSKIVQQKNLIHSDS